jgi:hypothetical protein
MKVRSSRVVEKSKDKWDHSTNNRKEKKKIEGLVRDQKNSA